MLTLSPLLLWAVFQILICGSQTKPNGDPEYCQYVEVNKCQETDIKTECINHCKTDRGFCKDLGLDKCTEAFVNTSCPKKCKSPVPVVECTPPWFTIGDQCFLVEPDVRNWASARQYCKAKATGGDLAQPRDIKALADHMEVNGKVGWNWVGGSNKHSGKEWRWINGTKITGGWIQGYPGTAVCLAMVPNYDANSLAAGNCQVKLNFVCQHH